MTERDTESPPVEGPGYRQLRVWRRSMELVECIYALTKSWPDAERFGLISQIQRASVSIPANIAEGYGRSHRGDCLRHLSIASGSLMEVETLLTIAVRVGVCHRDTASECWTILQETGRMLTRLNQSLQREQSTPNQTPGPRPQTPPPKEALP